jgi:hypothetical protein
MSLFLSVLVGIGSIPHPPPPWLANKGKVSTCHTERIKAKREDTRENKGNIEDTEISFLVVLATGG